MTKPTWTEGAPNPGEALRRHLAGEETIRRPAPGGQLAPNPTEKLAGHYARKEAKRLRDQGKPSG